MYKKIEVRWSGDLPGTPQQVWDGFRKHAAVHSFAGAPDERAWREKVAA